MVIFLFMYKFLFGSVARSNMSNVEDKSNCFSSIGFSRKVGGEYHQNNKYEFG